MSRTHGPWQALRLELPATQAEEIGAQLGLGSLGLELAERPDGRVTVSVYAAPGQPPARLTERARRVLAAHGLAPEGCAARVESVGDGQWVERYQQGLRPFPLGRRFVVEPTGAGGPAVRGRIALRLVPGRAFGTGEHATTRLCAEALERWVRPGESWADLGTGSGILAMVALHCGASRVEALDVDPEAVEVAREVLRANGLDRAVRLSVGSAEGWDAPRVRGAVANIETSYFLERSGELAAVVEPGGLLIAAGFLTGQRAAVERALRHAGCRTVEHERRDGWSALVLRRDDAGSG